MSDIRREIAKEYADYLQTQHTLPKDAGLIQSYVEDFIDFIEATHPHKSLNYLNDPISAQDFVQTKYHGLTAKTRQERQQILLAFQNSSRIQNGFFQRLERRRKKLSKHPIAVIISALFSLILFIAAISGFGPVFGLPVNWFLPQFAQTLLAPTWTPSPIPTATPTSTFTATPSPTATISPTWTPTATQLEGTAFPEGQVGVVLADFEQIDANAPNAVRNLEIDLRDMNIMFVRVHHLLTSKEEAQAISDLYNATIVIWGNVALGGVRVYFEVTPRRSEVETTVDSLRVFPSSHQEFETYLFTGMDSIYIVDFVRGQIAYFEDDYVRAIDAFDRAIKLIPAKNAVELKVATLYFYRATTYGRLGNLSEAISNFNEAIQLQPDFGVAYYNRGVMFGRLNNLEEAIADYTRAIELDPSDTSPYFNRAHAFYRQGKLKETIADYTRVIELNPKDDDAYNDRGSVYFDQGDGNNAMADFNQSISLNPNNALAYYNRGLIFDSWKKLNAAIADYTKAIQLNPAEPDFYFRRANIYSNTDRFSEAIYDYNKVIKLAPNYAQAIYNRSVIYFQLNKLPEALADLDRDIELDPRNAEAYDSRGVIYNTQGKLSDALKDFDVALELNPKFTKAYYHRGVNYLYLHMEEQSIIDFTRAIELDSEYIDAYVMRGVAYQRRQNYQDALADFQKYQQLAGSEAEAQVLALITQLEVVLGTPTPNAK